MQPTALLNVAPELMVERARAGLPSSLLACADDRAWNLGICSVLLTLAVLLTVVMA